MVKDIRTGSAGSFYTNVNNERQLFKIFNNELFFIVLNTNQAELWKTDGTEAGTIRVYNFGGVGFPVYSVKGETATLGVELNGFLYFAVKYDNGTVSLWKTDGTSAGTTFITHGFSNIQEFTVYNGFVYFAGESPSNGNELWRTNGTNSGTNILYNIFPDDINFVGKSSNPSYLTVFNNELYFKARGYDYTQNTIIGSELYKTDGNTLTLVKNINTATNVVDTEGSGLNLPKFIEFQNELYFIASDNQDNEYDLWKTDGTETGTLKMVDNLEVSASSIQFQSPIVYNDKIFFHNFQQLWVTDGTNGGVTMQLTDNGDTTIPIQTFSNPMLIMFDKLWFSGYTSDNKQELWSVYPSALGLDDEMQTPLQISVFPNPTSNLIYINSTQPIQYVEIYNSLGQLLSATYRMKKIDIKYLSSGLYLAKIKVNDNIIAKKIIKK